MTNFNLDKLLLAIFACLLATLACTLPSLSTLTTEWFVATSGDDSNSCRSTAAPCLTIAAAISKAAAGDLIHVAPGTYDEINLVIDKNLLILGDDEATTILDASGGSPLFQVNASGDSHFALSEMTLRNGEVAFNIRAGSGVTLTNVTIEDFTAPVSAETTDNNDGNGIINNEGTLEIFDGTLRNISVPGSDSEDNTGAILNYGSAEIRNSSVEMIGGHALFNKPSSSAVISNVFFDTILRVAIYSNDATLSIGSSSFINIGVDSEVGGSGVVNSGDLASAIVENTTFSHSIYGIQNINGGQATIAKSTFSFNEFGLAASDAPARVRLTNATFSGNTIAGLSVSNLASVDLHNLTITGNFDGLFVQTVGNISLQNTLITESGRSNCIFGSSGSIVSDGYNLDDDGTCVLTGTGDISGVSAPLQPLADNGGATYTHGFFANGGHPAVDAGNPGGCIDPVGVLITEDQRGTTRPTGGACDIGAYEADTGSVSIPLIGEEEEVPELTLVPPTISFLTGTVNTDTLCWVGPGSLYDVIQALKAQSIVDIKGLGLDGDWYVIDSPAYPGLNCWVAEDDVDVSVSLPADLFIFSVPPLPTPTPTVTPLPPTPTLTPVQGCMHQGPNDNQPTCYAPCPSNPNPGDACTP